MNIHKTPKTAPKMRAQIVKRRLDNRSRRPHHCSTHRPHFGPKGKSPFSRVRA